MSTTTCVICKQEILEYSILTAQGPVHPGPCYDHIINIPITEDQENLIEQTQLLL